MRTSIEDFGDGAEVLLARRIPNMQLAHTILHPDQERIKLSANCCFNFDKRLFDQPL